MKELSNYISEIELDEQFLGESNDINEGLFDWLKNFMSKTTDFVKTWWEKGGKQVDAKSSKGSIQFNNSPIKQNLNAMKKQLNGSEVWRKVFPTSNKYINNEHVNLYPADSKLSQKDWENEISELFGVFTPKVHYNGENYPASLCYYSDKVKPIDGYLHIFHFEVSTIMNGISNKELFEETIEKIFNGKKYDGLTMSSKKQPMNLAYKMSSQWESTDIENIWKLVF